MKNNKPDYLLYTILFTSGILVGFFISGMKDTTTTQNITETTKSYSQETISKTNSNPLFNTNSPFLGATQENPAITIVEFSDFQCKFCKDYALNAFQNIKKDYTDTNRIKYIFRNYPLKIHNQATYAAVAALCAKDQNKFWKMHDILFKEQDSWSDKEDYKNIIEALAVKIKLDKKAFNTCVNNPNPKLITINQDIEDGQKLNLTATPTIFINNKNNGIVGSQKYDFYKTIIEKLINTKKDNH